MGILARCSSKRFSATARITGFIASSPSNASADVMVTACRLLGHTSSHVPGEHQCFTVHSRHSEPSHAGSEHPNISLASPSSQHAKHVATTIASDVTPTPHRPTKKRTAENVYTDPARQACRPWRR